jgi:hypothetical protein
MKSDVSPMRGAKTGLIISLLALVTCQAAQAENGAANLRTYFSGATILSYDSRHGTQVEYHAPNGRSYLWYPGNTLILSAHWRIQADQLCYLYPSSSYNPVTGDYGGNWECRSASRAMERNRERSQGDIFGLSRSSRPPFVLSKGQTTLAQLMRQRPAR